MRKWNFLKTLPIANNGYMQKHVFFTVCGLVLCICLAFYLVLKSRHGVQAVGGVETKNGPVLNMAVGEILTDSVPAVSVEDRDSGNTSCIRHEINIPESMKETLKKWDSDFIVWRSTEYSPNLCLNISTSPALALNAGLGDFNGDGIQDVVVAGHNSQDELLVVVLSQKDAGYKIAQLCSSGINGTSLQGAGGCLILGTGSADGLKLFPRAAIYRVLPAGTRVNVSTGHSDEYVSVLKSEAFIAGLSQDFSGQKQDYKNPFVALQLFWWNFRDEPRQEWKWLNAAKDFRAWNINAIDDNAWEFEGLALGC